MPMLQDAKSILRNAIATIHIRDGAVTNAKLAGSIGATKESVVEVTPSVSLAAESGNAIVASVQLKDRDNANVSASVRCKAEIIDANGALAASAAWTIEETGPGTPVTTNTKAQLVFDTNSSGVATLTVADVSGSHAGTVYLRIEPLNRRGYPSLTALTFA